MNNQKASSYRDKSDRLFGRWKDLSGTVEYTDKKKTQTLVINHKNNIFVKDGVICPERWFNQEIRPLFLLKEAHGGEDDWDLIDDQLALEHHMDKIWQRVSLWTKGMLGTTKDSIVTFTEYDNEAQNYGNDYLKQAAVINVKKSGGENTSEMKDVLAYADFDKERLKEQLELCDPTVIVCGYTIKALDIIMGYNIREIHNSNSAYKISLNGHDVLVLDYWHPSNHYPDIMNYYGLMGVYQAGLKLL